jgi:DUF4097 and DUF4098 domain-containing protein YvlB
MNKWMVLAGICLATVAHADQSIEQSLPNDPAGAVEITATSGEVALTAWDKNEVAVSGEIGDSEQLELQRRGDTVVIRIVDKHGRGDSDDSSNLLVRAPAANRVGISVVSADVKVRGMVGGQRLQSVSGDIDTEVAGAGVELRSLSGAIHAQGKGLRSRLTLNTVSGDAILRNVSGEIETESVSGDIDLQIGTLDRGRFKTVSGDMRVRGALAPNARVEATSVSGDLRYSLPGAEKANALIEAFSGDIRPCYGNVKVVTATYGPGSSWRYSPEKAAGDIQVKTLSGDIEICNR